MTILGTKLENPEHFFIIKNIYFVLQVNYKVEVITF